MRLVSRNSVVVTMAERMRQQSVVLSVVRLLMLKVANRALVEVMMRQLIRACSAAVVRVLSVVTVSAVRFSGNS